MKKLSEQEIETIKTLRDQGFKVSYIQFKTHRSVKTIQKYSVNKNAAKPWTREEIQRANGLRNFGFSNREIGQQLGRTKDSVKQMLIKYNRALGLNKDKRKMDKL